MGNLERDLSPETDNPLNAGFNFLFTILYTLILKDFLELVLDNAEKIPWAVWPLVVLLLLEILHFALEDYLYTKNLADELHAKDVRLTVIRYLIHFVGIVALYYATVAVGSVIDNQSELVTATTIRPAMAVALVALAGQYLTFGAWQMTTFYEKWRDWNWCPLDAFFDPGYDSEIEEARTWTPRFFGYMAVLVLLASGIGSPFWLPNSGAVGLVSAAVLLFSIIVVGRTDGWQKPRKSDARSVVARHWANPPRKGHSRSSEHSRGFSRSSPSDSRYWRFANRQFGGL